MQLSAVSLGMQDSCAAASAFVQKDQRLLGAMQQPEACVLIAAVYSYLLLSNWVPCADMADMLVYKNPALCMVLACVPGRPAFLSVLCRIKAPVFLKSVLFLFRRLFPRVGRTAT